MPQSKEHKELNERFGLLYSTKEDNNTTIKIELIPESENIKQFIKENFIPKSELKEIKINEYRKGFNDRLKEEGKTGEEHQHLYL